MKKTKLLLAAAALMLGGSVWAQTDVTSTYITNANFEGEYTEHSRPRNDSGQERAIYQPDGWTVTYTNGNENDFTALNSSCLQWNNFSGQRQPSNGGDNTYWSRFRWGSSTQLTLSQTVTLPAGTYSLSADAYKSASAGIATISAAGKSVTVDTRNEWANYTIVFSLSASTSVTIAYSYAGQASDTRTGVDNFKLINITQGVSDITAQNWTSAIANASFEAGTSGEYGSGQNHVYIPYGFTMNCTMEGWRDGSINTTNPSEGSKLYNYWAGTTTSLDIYQTLQLPAGKYTITADLRTEDGKISNQGVYAKIGDDTFKSATIQTIGDPWNGAEAWNTLSKDFYVQSDGSVQVGASSTGGASSVGWFQIDNFTLSYKGAIQNTVSSITPEVATSVTNDKWYAVEISANGEYKIISSVDNTVYYTQNGAYVPSDVTTYVTLTASEKEVVDLSAGTLYVRATADATLTVAPNVYTYSVGDGTTSVANNGYTQSNTMTVTFADATTNDPDGALSILDASKIKVNSVAASASIEGNVLTVTLASPLAPSTDYLVSIEAGAVGYNAENANAAISRTAKTPAVFDGTYFIATTDGTQFISRGGDSNTEAVLDKYGIAVSITTDASNVTHFQFVDNDKNLFGGSSSIYTDKNESDLEGDAARARWTVASVSGGYTLYSGTWSKYIKAGTGAESGKPAATYDDAAYTWVLETPAAHQTKMAAYKDANAAAVATAAGLSLTTVAALETELGSNWTSNSVDPSDAYSSVNEQYQPNGYGENIFTQKLEGLKNGIYKVTLSIFHRIRDYATTYTLHQANADNPTAYLYANNQQVQLPSPLSEYRATSYGDGWPTYSPEEGKNYPNNTDAAGTAFDEGLYNVVVYTVVTDGTLSIGVKDPGKYNNANWICWRDLAVTSYVYNGDYSSLNTAITTAEASIGFEAGEYAPYNNVESMGKLASAKALYASQDAINQDAIDGVKAELTSAEWSSANVGEVNAIYNGTFAASVNDGAPDGWKSSTNILGGSYHARAFVLTSGKANYDNLEAFGQGDTRSAFYIRFDGTNSSTGTWYTYGNTDGYTIPLKAATTYYVKLQAGAWGNYANKNLSVTIKDAEGTGVLATTLKTTKKTNNGEGVDQLVTVFTTNDAGNYTLSFWNGNGENYAAIVSNIELKKAAPEAVTVSSAGYATYASDYPLDFTDSSIKAYIAEANGTTGVTFTQINKVPAGTGVLLYKDGGETESIPFFAGDADATTGNVFVRGTGATVASVVETTKHNYILNNGASGIGFYRAAGQTVATNRAYIQIDEATPVKEFISLPGFEDDADGISLTPALSDGEGEIYNLAGQRMNKMQKGINIVNGKKVLF